MPIGTHVPNNPAGSVADDWSGRSVAIGADSSADLQYNADGTKRVVPKVIAVTVLLTASTVPTHIFVADDAYQVTGIRHVVSTGASGATLTVGKTTGTTAPASATIVTTAALDLNATANTSTTATLLGTVATLQLAAGGRLSIFTGGTLTGLVGMVTIFLKRISNT